MVGSNNNDINNDSHQPTGAIYQRQPVMHQVYKHRFTEQEMDTADG